MKKILGLLMMMGLMVNVVGCDVDIYGGLGLGPGLGPEIEVDTDTWNNGNIKVEFQFYRDGGGAAHR